MNSLPEVAQRPSRSPKAQREQFDVQAYEGGLLALARVHHPTIAWWHGYRKQGDWYGSYCYVCEQMIATWDRFGETPQECRQVIDDHKRLHRAGIRPASGITMEGKATQ